MRRARSSMIVIKTNNVWANDATQDVGLTSKPKQFLPSSNIVTVIELHDFDGDLPPDGRVPALVNRTDSSADDAA